MRKMIVVIGLTFALAACTQPGAPAAPGEIGVNKTTGGALVGAGLGGLLGNQFGGGAGKGVMTLVGVLAGGFIGSQIGKSLDQNDLLYANRATQTSLESGQPGQPLPWSNPQSGASGTVTPQSYYQASNGQYCREFQQKITVGGQTQEGYGTACRQPDGTWKIVQ